MIIVMGSRTGAWEWTEECDGKLDWGLGMSTVYVMGSWTGALEWAEECDL